MGGVVHPDMDIMKVHNTFPYECRLLSEQDVSRKLCVYTTFREKPQAEHRPYTTVRAVAGYAMRKVTVMEISLDQGNRYNFSHTDSGIFFHLLSTRTSISGV
jgi:hypothetical protein